MRRIIFVVATAISAGFHGGADVAWQLFDLGFEVPFSFIVVSLRTPTYAVNRFSCRLGCIGRISQVPPLADDRARGAARLTFIADVLGRAPRAPRTSPTSFG